MSKAGKLMKILSDNHTKAIPEKYAKVIIQVATLEERIKMMMSLGLVSKSKSLSKSLETLLKQIREEYLKDNK